jgi:Zn-finger nucleic acid-binding protein
MKPFQAGKVELDRCTFCRGLWFDGGELETVLGKKLAPTFSAGMQTSRKCATCSKPMVPAELGGLRIEVCRIDRGFFLDENELVALNGGKRVTVGQAPVAARPEAKVQDDVRGWLDSLGV